MKLPAWYRNFSLFEDQFDHPSELHGINHTYRVMVHVHFLGNSNFTEKTIQLAMCATFIHDMARQHDGYCTDHGRWAAERKLPQFEEFFFEIGVAKKDIPLIRTAITNHSLKEELEPTHPAWEVTALLKDADALDRIRLGEDNLDASFLRLKNSSKFIPFAIDLYFSTRNRKFSSFDEVLKTAEIIQLKTQKHG